MLQALTSYAVTVRLQNFAVRGKIRRTEVYSSIFEFFSGARKRVAVSREDLYFFFFVDPVGLSGKL